MKTAARRRPIKRRSLFTLVELVAAMAVMIFVALIIGTASSAFYNAWKRSVRLTDRMKNYQNIDRVMDVCVRNMIPFSWKNDEDEEKVVFQGKADEMFFTARRRAVKGENSAYLFIRLKLDNEKLIAEYHTLPRFPWTEDGKYEMKQEVLTENVKAVSFLYAALEDDEVVWNDEWEDYDSTRLADNPSDILLIPPAVQLSVEWNDGSREVWLRRTSGYSRHSRLGQGGGL